MYRLRFILVEKKIQNNNQSFKYFFSKQLTKY